MKEIINNRHDLFQENMGFIVILMIIPIPYWFSNTVVLNYTDMYRYIAAARDFQQGDWRFFFTSTRTNLFSFILFLTFELLGESFIAIKCLFVFVIELLLIECWILGRLLFKNNSGLITAILVSTSYTFVHFIYFPHIDLLLLVSLLGCIIALYIALESKPDSIFWTVFSGAVIGLSFLLKEASIWLLFFTPVYSLLTRTSFKTFLKRWSLQLLPLIIIASPLIYLHHDAFYGRYVHRLNSWVSVILSGDASRVISTAGGVYQADPSFLHLITFPFAPIFWQWEAIFPIPNNLILLEQLFLLCFGIFFFLKRSSVTNNIKIFLLTILIVFLPRYIVFSVKAYKIRQILIIFFVLYPILGNTLHNFFKRIKSLLLTYTSSNRIQAALIMLIFTLYCLRMVFCLDGIGYTLNMAEFNYQRRNMGLLQSEVR